jgi:hypothetical protein
VKSGLALPPEFSCPNHPSVGLIMLCTRCRRVIEAHMERVDRHLPPVVKP